MSGICGMFGAGDLRCVTDMTTALGHRGPNGQAVMRFDQVVLGAAQSVLSRAESPGRQPGVYNGIAVVLDGEIYNHLDLRRQYLPDEPFETGSSAESLARLFGLLGMNIFGLLEGVFAAAISDGQTLVLGRDLLGQKPLYMAQEGELLYFASELKALAPFTPAARSFPPGMVYHTQVGWKEPGELLPLDGDGEELDPGQAQERLVELLRQAVARRMQADDSLAGMPGVSLSGGLDSSIVAALARPYADRLETFSVGMQGSRDLAAARLVAKHLGTHHNEMEYTLGDMLAVLPEVVYALESFDPALVRSSIPNYFQARIAQASVKVFLTGEGADELFAGYAYMDDIRDPQALQNELLLITRSLHNTALQRGDRLPAVFGLQGRLPFLDLKVVRFALSLPPAWKLHEPDRPAKAFLRQACAGLLPEQILNRPKEKFSQGAGSSQVLAVYAQDAVSDADFRHEQQRLSDEWSYALLNKETLMYYRLLRENFSDEVIFPNLGISRSL